MYNARKDSCSGLLVPIQGSYFNDNRTNEIPIWSPTLIEVPDTVRNKVTAQDYVYFTVPESMPGNLYDVAVETNDVSLGHQFKTVGGLTHAVKLPAVRFAPHARIMLLPKRHNMPRFVAELVRGAMYIPYWPKQMGEFTLKMSRSGGIM